ncbi:adenosylcobinamide amidohydrolase [Actinoplanes sp. NPDC051859]|uniref:adenosylcobinamide amidohydrolase n=1 Tax=Actinoplanes sp. NPDC051859 TaxID=3363909 RepID=UPI00379EB335
MIAEPVHSYRAEGGCAVPLLSWTLPEPVLAISSAVLGGGIGPRRWIVNATVPMSYDRDDPADHLREIAAELQLSGPGIGLLTGVDVADVVVAEDEDVRLWATVGLGAPVQAAAPDVEVASQPGVAPRAGTGTDVEVAPHAGTVNIVAWVPRRLSDGALVNAVATLTEAKTQAIRELGLDATGTATDAVAVLCPLSGPEVDYAGPRSQWGRRLARAGHRAVLAGGAVNLSGLSSWSERRGDR